VLVAPFRSPVLAARQLAMLDYLSAGRVLPAVGIGGEQERGFRAARVPFRERGRRTDEAIRIMRQCWEEPEVTYAGEFWRLDRITVLPRPLQQPMPLWIGGNSEAAMGRGGPPRGGRGGPGGARGPLRAPVELLPRPRPGGGARARASVHPARASRRAHARGV